ncbi:hypothetical protein N7539_005335 [Penicillium diatomitis]|uniref:Ubiquinol-cytochrome c chaperone domain-containing protein n=1 Tax=Penicillium diatomitis TaxID=2819901 RepID=A0A9W9X6T2_9EURO|nr:uncharacterized protein N7539_005335 [Penicillium diatomitis]KAJ5485347.1 hypothetical protein N7539_005335 [Penicillium diatomitis]
MTSRANLSTFTPRSTSTSPALMQSATTTTIPSKSPASRSSTAPSARRISSTSRSYAQGGSGSAISRLAKSALSPGSSGETYVAYGMTQKLFQACSSQADYQVPQATQKGVPVPTTEAGEHLGVSDSWWYKEMYQWFPLEALLRLVYRKVTALFPAIIHDPPVLDAELESFTNSMCVFPPPELGLVPTFSTWSQITFLHMYLLTVRLRALPNRESFQTYSRHLIDHFSHNAEHRMDDLHDIGSRSIRNKYLKDLFVQWRGIIAAYDEGLIKGDAVLGAAVWRNLWKAEAVGPDGKELDWSRIALVVAYMRRVTAQLGRMEEADIVMELSGATGQESRIFGFSPLDRKMVEGMK